MYSSEQEKSWEKEDAHIRISIWNSMEYLVSSSLVYLDTAKQVWDRAKEMFSGIGNFRHAYNLRQAFFSLSPDDMLIEAFYSKFRNICEEIALSEPITSHIF